MTTHELETGQTILLELVPRTATNLSLRDRVDRIRSGQSIKTALCYTCSEEYTWIALNEKIVADLIGTVQYPDVISFDPEPFVEPLIVRTEVPARAAGFRDWHAFRNYMNDKYPNACETKEASLLSLLQSLGRYWVNPLGRKPERVVPFMGAGQYTENQLWALDEYNKILKAWQEAESRKLSVEQMVVVIQVKK